jgi:hypothetical protein
MWGANPPPSPHNTFAGPTPQPHTPNNTKPTQGWCFGAARSEVHRLAVVAVVPRPMADEEVETIFLDAGSPEVAVPKQAEQPSALPTSDNSLQQQAEQPSMLQKNGDSAEVVVQKADPALPSMDRLKATNAKWDSFGFAIRPAHDVTIKLESSGKGLNASFVMQGPAEAIELLSDAERRGVLSPITPITVPVEARKSVGIPADAHTFAYAYPLPVDDSETVADLIDAATRGATKTTQGEPAESYKVDAWLNFVLVGGYCYFDANESFVCANALTPRLYAGASTTRRHAPYHTTRFYFKSRDTRHAHAAQRVVCRVWCRRVDDAVGRLELQGPIPAHPAAGEALQAAGRMRPVTLPSLTSIGFTAFAWVNPDEAPAGAPTATSLALPVGPSRQMEPGGRRPTRPLLSQECPSARLTCRSQMAASCTTPPSAVSGPFSAPHTSRALRHALMRALMRALMCSDALSTVDNPDEQPRLSGGTRARALWRCAGFATAWR